MLLIGVSGLRIGRMLSTTRKKLPPLEINVADCGCVGLYREHVEVPERFLGFVSVNSEWLRRTLDWENIKTTVEAKKTKDERGRETG